MSTHFMKRKIEANSPRRDFLANIMQISLAYIQKQYYVEDTILEIRMLL